MQQHGIAPSQFVARFPWKIGECCCLQHCPLAHRWNQKAAALVTFCHVSPTPAKRGKEEKKNLRLTSVCSSNFQGRTPNRTPAQRFLNALQKTPSRRSLGRARGQQEQRCNRQLHWTCRKDPPHCPNTARKGQVSWGLTRFYYTFSSFLCAARKLAFC